MIEKLTKTLINRIEGNGREQIIWDTEVKGLGLRISPSGAKSFIVKYRIGSGRDASLRKPTIGRVDDLTVDQARAIARGWKVSARDGLDPQRKRKAEASAPTVKLLCDEYMKRHGSRKRSGFEDLRRIEQKVLPRLGRVRVKDVSMADIDDLHRRFSGTPYEANRVLALLSKMFALSVQWGWRAENPARGVKKYQEEKRERYMVPEELQRLMVAMEAYAETSDQQRRVAVDAIRMLVLTGARKQEVLRATWDQFDLEKGVWIKPSSHTKQNKLHRVPLSQPVLQLLKSRPRVSEFVFPGAQGGHRADVKSAWITICSLASLEGFRVHDLRHTFASVLVSGGTSLPVIGALLGHTQSQTTMRYAHLQDAPLRDAASMLGRVLAERSL